MSIEKEELQGVDVVWSLKEEYGSMVNEISAADIQWAVHSRPANSNLQWTINTIDQKVVYS